jgi:hypothetical protein
LNPSSRDFDLLQSTVKDQGCTAIVDHIAATRMEADSASKGCFDLGFWLFNPRRSG